MGRVRFETEYSTEFKKHDLDKIPLARSPILKPRNRSPPRVQSTKASPSKENDPNAAISVEAGLRSYEAHVGREPPLQHKTIVEHARNHNIIPTKTTKHFEESAISSSDTEKFDNVDKITVPQSKATDPILVDYDDLAGRPSDRVGYLAIEPPMQRKSKPVFHRAKMDHVHDSLAFDDDNSDVPIPANITNARSHKRGTKGSKHDKVQRKLNFKDDSSQDAIDKYDKQKDSVTVAAGKPSPVNVSTNEGVKRSPPKPLISPSKLRRKEDLKAVEEKQSDRVKRALQLRAGMQNIEPPLHSHPTKTEYQRQFAWKRPIKFASPVLSAEKFVFKSDQSLKAPVPVISGPPKKTEYQSVFAPPKFKPESRNAKDVSNNDQSATPAGVPSGRSLEDRKREKQSKNAEAKPLPPQPKQRFVTEYRGNYCSPAKFKVKSGAWLGDYPPQLQPELEKWEKESDKSDWFKEVLRLRAKAREFRVRTEETHFPTSFGSVTNSSTSSRSASVMSDPIDSLDRDKEAGLVPVANEDNRNTNAEAATAHTKNSAYNNVKLNDGKGEDADIDKVVNNRTDVLLDQGDVSDIEDSSTEDAPSGSANGRLPTPRLRVAPDHRRHHLDPTTPAVGGALLVSPNKYKYHDDYRPVNPARVAWANMDENGIISDDKSDESSSIAADRRISKPRNTAKTRRKQKRKDNTHNGQRNGIEKHDITQGRTYHIGKSDAVNKHNENNEVPYQEQNYDSSKYDSTSNKETTTNKVVSSDDEPHPLSPSSMSARSSVISDIHERSIDRRNNFWS